MAKFVRAHNVLAVVLVGGEGSRLGPLTLYRTKPAVMVGPTILASFSTSSALNSGVEKVLMASQYLPFSLETFYSATYGSEFGHYKKVDMIGPHHNRENATRYKGTADAFHDALKVGVKHQREYVLGLSGDHIYSYDFTKLFSVFPEMYDDDTFIVFTKKVPRAEAPRFGILETAEGGTKVEKFVEKPPLAELAPDQEQFDASMGIYFAPLRLWQRILEVDQKRGAAGKSKHDIGGDIIPRMIAEKRFKVNVFRFDGFWADVGEPKALYDTCRAIFIKRSPDIFGDRVRPIGSVGDHNFYSSKGLSYFTSGKCSLENSAVNGSIFSPGVEVRRSEVLDSMILGKTESNYLSIHNSTIRNAIVDKMCNINQAEIISDKGLIVVARRTIVAKGVKIHARGNAVVASLTELVDKIHRLEKYIKATGAELYDSFGNRHEFAELVELKDKNQSRL